MDRHDWDERYGAEDLLWKADPNRFLPGEVSGLPVGRALDLACGEGRNALWLAEQGWEVVGVDFSNVALAKAARLAVARDLTVTWIEADVLEWEPPAESFDLVVVMYLQLPEDSRHRVLSGLPRALAPGGTLLVVAHDLTNLTEGVGGPKDPTVLCGPEDVARDLEGLRIDRAARVRRPVVTDDGGREAVDLLVRAVRPG